MYNYSLKFKYFIMFKIFRLLKIIFIFKLKVYWCSDYWYLSLLVLIELVSW